MRRRRDIYELSLCWTAEKPLDALSPYLYCKGCFMFYCRRRVCFAGKGCPFCSVTRCGFLSLHGGCDARILVRSLVTRVTLPSSVRIKGLRRASIIGGSHPVKAAHRKVAINYSVYQAPELTVIQDAFLNRIKRGEANLKSASSYHPPPIIQ